MLAWSLAILVAVVFVAFLWRRGRRRQIRRGTLPVRRRPTPQRTARTARVRAAPAAALPRPVLEAPRPARVGMAALEDVHDPVTATTTLIHVVAGPVGWPAIREKVLVELAGVTSLDRAGDAIMFAEWAVRQGLDEHRAIDALAGTLCRHLGKNELALVTGLLDDAASAGGPEAEPYVAHAKSQLVATAS